MNIRNVLYTARSLVNAFDIETAQKYLQDLKISHLTAVVWVEDEPQRKSWLKKAKKGNWSVRKLRTEIKGAIGYQGSGGRRHSVSSDDDVQPAVVIKQLKNMTRTWNAYHEAWFEEKQALEKTQATDKLTEEAKQVMSQLKQLKKRIQQEIKDLNHFVGE